MAKRTLALLLAVLVVAGMEVPSGIGGIVAKPAAAAAMDGMDGCTNGCADGSVDAMACPLSTCAAPVLAANPPVLAALVAQSSRLPLPAATNPRGLSSLPDPYPPRTIALV